MLSHLLLTRQQCSAMCCISCSHTLSLLLCVLTLTPTATGAGPETLCGAELVDTLQFVMKQTAGKDHQGYIVQGKPTGYGPNARRSRGIVDECCFQSCELRRLEMYCAPAKTSKAARSVRAQRHTDMPRTPKVSTGHKVDKGTERRTAQQPDKTKNKKHPLAPGKVGTDLGFSQSESCRLCLRMSGPSCPLNFAEHLLSLIPTSILRFLRRGSSLGLR
ncbi:hypothetical protein INR49_004987 [Caranx melampygus]|nr:hypothetical protein INR49_004987 [Caranx melampygus]